MNIEQYIQSINESLHRVVSASQGLSEDIVRWKPSDDQWSVIQVLCHVEEATLYWLNEITLLAKVPGSEWGRGLQHEGRLAAVGQAAERNTQDAIRGIEGAKTKVAEVLSALSEDLLKHEAPSRNPRFGIKPLSFIIDHLLVEHLETHIKQIHRTVEQYNEANKLIKDGDVVEWQKKWSFSKVKKFKILIRRLKSFTLDLFGMQSPI